MDKSPIPKGRTWRLLCDNYRHDRDLLEDITRYRTFVTGRDIGVRTAIAHFARDMRRSLRVK